MCGRAAFHPGAEEQEEGGGGPWLVGADEWRHGFCPEQPSSLGVRGLRRTGSQRLPEQDVSSVGQAGAEGGARWVFNDATPRWRGRRAALCALHHLHLLCREQQHDVYRFPERVEREAQGSLRLLLGGSGKQRAPGDGRRGWRALARLVRQSSGSRGRSGGRDCPGNKRRTCGVMRERVSAGGAFACALHGRRGRGHRHEEFPSCACLVCVVQSVQQKARVCRVCVGHVWRRRTHGDGGGGRRHPRGARRTDEERAVAALAHRAT